MMLRRVKYNSIMIYRNNQDYITAFIEGYICAIIGERMTIAKVSEAELDNAKHSAEKYVEFQIEHSDFSEEEKESETIGEDAGGPASEKPKERSTEDSSTYTAMDMGTEQPSENLDNEVTIPDDWEE